MFKKIILSTLLILFLMPSASARPVNEVYGGVSDGQLIYYSFKSNKWYYQRPKHRPSRVLEVTRRITPGLEEYSEYVSPMGQVYTPAGSNYEFLYKGRLITYHIYDLKFFEIVYNKRNKAFIEVPLEEKEIKKLMGNPKIIKISDFDNENRIVVKKLPLKNQWYLILNDTDKYFYRYIVVTNEKDDTIVTLFRVKRPTTIIYSHYVVDRDEFPPYKIRVKNGIN